MLKAIEELAWKRLFAVVLVLARDSASRPYRATNSGRVTPTALRADTIVATDYAYRYARTLTPGVHDFAFVNGGKQRHEAILLLLKPGVTVQQLHDAGKAGVRRDSLVDEAFGVLHSPAGTSPKGLLSVQLLAGREYAIICNFADTDSSPPHFMLGMIGGIRVTGTPAGG